MATSIPSSGAGDRRTALVEYDLLPGDTRQQRAVRAAHRVYEHLVQLWAPGVIEAASDVGLFQALAEQPAATARELAARLSADEKATRLLLDALCVYEIATREPGPDEQDLYGLSEAMRDCLLPGRYSLVGKMAYDRAVAWDAWRGLARAVRDGAVDHEGHAQVNQISAEHYRTLVGGINFWAPPIVDILAQALARRGWAVDAPKRMLDVGCGTGLYSQLLMERFAGLTAVGYDVPDILVLAGQQAQELGVAARFSGEARDFGAGDWSTGQDLVLIANIFEMQTPKSALDLVLRAARALATGGILAVVDQIVCGGPQTTQDRFATLFAVSMLATGGGDSYRVADYDDWFATAGLESIELLDTPMHRVLLARRPGERVCG